MADSPKCPYCGFVSHMVSSDEKTVAYVCERGSCKKIFHE